MVCEQILYDTKHVSNNILDLLLVKLKQTTEKRMRDFYSRDNEKYGYINLVIPKYPVTFNSQHFKENISLKYKNIFYFTEQKC